MASKDAATVTIGFNATQIVGRLYDIVQPERKTSGGGSYLKFLIDVGVTDDEGCVPIIVSKFYRSVNDDQVQDLARAIEEDRSLVFVQAYIAPNRGDSGVFMNVNATGFTLVGDQPSIEDEQLADDEDSGGGSILAVSSSKPAPKPRRTSKPKADAKPVAPKGDDKPF